MFSMFKRQGGPNPNSNLRNAVLKYLENPTATNLTKAINIYIQTKQPNFKKTTTPTPTPMGNLLNQYNKYNTRNGQNIYKHMTRNSSSVPFQNAMNGNYILKNGKFVKLVVGANQTPVNAATQIPQNIPNGKVNGAKMSGANKNVIKKNGRFFALGNGSANRQSNKYYVVNRSANSMNFKYSNANKNAYNKAANSNIFTLVPKQTNENFVNANGNSRPANGNSGNFKNLQSWLNSLNENTKTNKVKLSNRYTSNMSAGKIKFRESNYQTYVKNRFPNIPLNGSALQ